jgi:hypothetical protein
MEMEPEPVYGCDHKFVDSTRCLKCGWEPSGDRARRRLVALAMWGGFYYCPTTGRVIEALEGDDKAICRCGVSNPNVPTERTAETGVHILRFQQDREEQAKAGPEWAG